jgi:hypothetical protein
MSELKPINNPMYDELAVKNNYDSIMENEKVAQYFPTQLSNSRPPERDYFCTVLNTLQLEYVKKFVLEANTVRIKP